jgi:hypothetical protein
MKKEITGQFKTELEAELLTIGPLNEKEINEIKKAISEVKNVGDAMDLMREMSFDLPSALDILGDLNSLNELDDTPTKHGSCQDWYLRVAAQLVHFYSVPVEAFYEWDT